LRPLGSSGVSISRVGLGSLELGPDTGEEPNVDRAVHVIETAVDAGLNWLDTSENYLETRNESLIGGMGPEPAFRYLSRVPSASLAYSISPDGDHVRV
jgi:aryl-alcohol dehydrogenase-like predicted oxidoreductase